MGMSPELERIKKKYGEKFAHLCRKHFSTILENEGKLLEIIENNFAESKNIYDDIVKNGIEIEFKDYIYGIYDQERKKQNQLEIEENRNPYEILDEAGYNLIECNTEEEIQSFKKWYAPNEVICTIYMGGRLESSVCFFAVKKNAEDIKRENFQNPKREDEYGTSVLGIQFDKQGVCNPHIITRYNHTVNNPNATYGNDLNKIAPGLEKSFENLLSERGLQLNNSNVTKFDFPGYTTASDGKYYKYNMEVNGVYYCENNVVIDHGEIKKFDKEKYLVLDNFVLDLVNKKMEMYDKTGYTDSFIDGFENITKIDIQKCKEENEDGNKIITISSENKKDIKIKIDKSNNIIEYENENLVDIDDNFLITNKKLRKIELPNAENIGNDFLRENEELSEIRLLKAKNIGDNFCWSNKIMKILETPEVETIGNCFLSDNRVITNISMPKVKSIGTSFLEGNKKVSEVYMPEVETIEKDFLRNNTELRRIVMPKAKNIGDDFLCENTKISEVDMPEAEIIGHNFLRDNREVTKISMPKAKKIGNNFLERNEKIYEVDMKNVEIVGNNYLHGNKALREIELPNAISIDYGFLRNNEILNKILIPKAKSIGNLFLNKNKKLRKISIPNVKKIGKWFLNENNMISEVEFPKNFEGKSSLIEHIKGILQENKRGKLSTMNIGKRTIGAKTEDKKTISNIIRNIIKTMKKDYKEK